MNVKYYKVIKEQGTDALENKIGLAIRDGWQPIGGIAVISLPDPLKPGVIMITFFQAMVRYD